MAVKTRRKTQKSRDYVMALDKVEQKKSLCGVELQYGRNKDNVKKTKKLAA